MMWLQSLGPSNAEIVKACGSLTPKKMEVGKWLENLLCILFDIYESKLLGDSLLPERIYKLWDKIYWFVLGFITRFLFL